MTWISVETFPFCDGKILFPDSQAEYRKWYPYPASCLLSPAQRATFVLASFLDQKPDEHGNREIQLSVPGVSPSVRLPVAFRAMPKAKAKYCARAHVGFAGKEFKNVTVTLVDPKDFRTHPRATLIIGNDLLCYLGGFCIHDQKKRVKLRVCWHRRILGRIPKNSGSRGAAS